MKTPLLFLVLFVTSIHTSVAQSALKRKARLDFSVSKLAEQPGARVSRINENSAAYNAGLRRDDILITINGEALPDENTLFKVIRSLRGGDKVSLQVIRNQVKSLSISFIADAAPYESYKTLDLEPVSLSNSSGDLLRAFVTKPKNSRGKLPAILFVSWLSCGTIELPESEGSWTKMMREVAEKTGCLMMRVEKPGVGDSNGTACSDCDLLTELDAYKAAWRHLKGRADVDTTNIVVFGASLGGTLASIVGKGQPVKAYVSAVSVYKTWLEHMIELERRRLQFSGKKQAEINELMPRFIEFHSEYLNYKKTPEQIALEKPHLAGLWYDEPRHQYGRPASFYMQAQGFNFMQTWLDTMAPVYVIAGEYDWIMSLDDSKLMVDMINEKTPGRATLNIAKGMDHHWSVYKTPQEAFDEVNGRYAQETVSQLIEWIKKVVSD